MTKKRISKQAVQAFFDKVAVIKPSTVPGDPANCYYSKIDGSYFTHVGLEEDYKFLLRSGITEELQSAHDGKGTVSLGFSPEEQKWFGWSHRAIFGFGIGSTCKKGDCGYVPATPEELFKDVTTPDEDGWAWQKPENVEIIENGIRIKAEMVKPVGGGTPVAAKIANACDEVIDGESGEIMDFESAEPEYFDVMCGRGEWTAKTLDDAKQMAIDFAKGVS